MAGEWPRLRDGVHRWFDRRLHGRRGDAPSRRWLANGPEGYRGVLDVHASSRLELLDAVSHPDGMTRAISRRAARGCLLRRHADDRTVLDLVLLRAGGGPASRHDACDIPPSRTWMPSTPSCG